MLDLTESFPAQCEDALALSDAFVAGLPDAPRPSNVVVTGLGGSAIGGDLAAALASVGSDVPIVVNRDYDLPGFAGPDTLLVASSYSGNTEETLSAYRQAVEAGCRIVCVTSGGELARMATENGTPVCRVPGGRPPRASTGYLFIPTLGAIAAHTPFSAECSPAAIRASLPLLTDCRKKWDRSAPLAENA
ncbi:MAG: SIS domain-containing protein, partial [Armatimonadetes bacterium]|nr:SIS domain-containing protein [Armatimonadota bacterium]